MAAKDGVLIETISKQVFDDMNKLITQLTEQIKLTNQLSTKFKKITLPSQTTKAAQATGAALKKTNIVITQYDKSLRKLKNAQIALKESQNGVGKAIAKVRLQTQQQNKLNKEAAIISSKLSSLYEKEQVRLTRLSKKYADLALKKQLNGKLSVKEELALRRTKKALDRKYLALKKVDAQMGRHGRNVGNYTRRLRGMASSLLGAFGVVGGVYAFAAVLRSSIRTVREYDKANATLSAVLQIEKKNMTELTDESIRLGRTTVKSAVEVVGLQVAYARLGFSMTDIIALTEATIEGSIALNGELDQTALLTGAMVNSFDEFSSSDAPMVMDVLALATARSALNFSKLMVALPIVGGAANALNIPFTEVVATLGKLADAGIETSTASTALRNIFIESAKLGIDYRDALNQVRNSTDQLKTSNEIFGKRAAVSAVTIAKNTEAVDILDIALQNAAGTAAEMAAKELDTLDGSIKLLDSAWKGLIITQAENGGVVESLKRNLKSLAENLEEVIGYVWFGVKAWIAYKVVLIAASLQLKFAGLRSKAAAAALVTSATAAQVATTAWARFTVVLRANAIGLILVGLTLLVSWLSKANASVTQHVDKLSEWSNELLGHTQKQTALNKVLTKQSDRYDKLMLKAERSTEEQYELDQIILLLTKHVPDAATKFDQYGNAIEISTQKVKDFNDAIAEDSFRTANRNIKEAKSALKGLMEEQKAYNKLQTGEATYIKGIGTVTKTGDDYSKIISNQLMHLKDNQLMNETKKEKIALTEEETDALVSNRVENQKNVQSLQQTILVNQEILEQVEFSKLSYEDQKKAIAQARLERGKETNSLADLRNELKQLKLEREGLNKTDKAGIKQTNDLIKEKQKEIDAFLGVVRTTKIVRTAIEGTVAKYEEEIAALKDKQKWESKTYDEYSKYERDIDSLTEKIRLHTEGQENYLSILKKIEKQSDNNKVKISITELTSIEDRDERRPSNSLLDKLVADKTPEVLQMSDALIKMMDDAVAADIALDELALGLDLIGRVAGGLVSSETLASIYDGFEDGTLTAKEALMSLGNVALDVIREIERVNKEALAERLNDLKLEQEVQLKLVGDNELAQNIIRERYAVKEKEAKEKSLQDTKTAATISAGINAALAITKVFAEIPPPASFIISGVIAGLTAYQIGIIQNQKIPAFEQGTRNAPGGTALVNERRNEVIVSPGGDISRPKGRNQLVNLEKGSHVYRSESEFNRELGGLLGGNGINSFGLGAQPSPNNKVKGKSLTKEDMTGAFKDALKGRSTNHVTIDKNGIGTYSVSQMNKTNRLNNRVTFKGKSV